MLIEYIRYAIPDERRVDFEAAYAEARHSLDASPHCLAYELARCVDDPTQWVLRIEWDSAEGHMQGFRKGAEFGPFLAAVRPFIPDILEMRHYEPSAVRSSAPRVAAVAAVPPVPAVPTLFEWAGGMPALERLTTEFYARVPADPLLGPIFAGMDPDHPLHVAHFLAEVLGGPATYSAERGGHAAMLGHHLRRHLTQEQRQRWMAMLLESADAVGLPSDPEFRSAFVGYLEWGTRLAVINSQDGVTPGPEQPMPRWGWGAVGGPYQGT